jgi:hypothetical protein
MIHQQTRPLPSQQNMNSTVTPTIHQPTVAQEEQCMVQENNDEQQQESNSSGCKRTSPRAKSPRKKQKLDD